MSFDQLGLAPALLKAVVASGYTSPTPIQAKAIPYVLAGHDLLGCAQTGTGKTAAFALPLLQRLGKTGVGSGRRPIRVLVLAPTRELAIQIGQSFHDYGKHTGLKHCVIYGGVGQRPQVNALQHGVDVVVATPGRLLDLMEQGYVRLDRVEALVLDEADRMLDMGFMPQIRRIMPKLPTRRQSLLFSATMPKPIEELANDILRDPKRIRLAPVRETSELIEQSVVMTSKQGKPELLVSILQATPDARALVFTRTKHGANKVAKHLNGCGVRSEAIHGNKSQTARQKALESFRSARPPVLVATDIAARGLDVDAISHVINYDLPHEPETYVHRIGRTGRAGATGVAIAFCDDSERPLLRDIERQIGARIPELFPAKSRRGKPASATVQRTDGPADAEPQAPKNAATRGGSNGNSASRAHDAASRGGAVSYDMNSGRPIGIDYSTTSAKKQARPQPNSTRGERARTSGPRAASPGSATATAPKKRRRKRKPSAGASSSRS